MSKILQLFFLNRKLFFFKQKCSYTKLLTSCLKTGYFWKVFELRLYHIFRGASPILLSRSMFKLLLMKADKERLKKFSLKKSYTPLAYAGFHTNGVLNDEMRWKLAESRLIWQFLPQTHGVCTLPSHPPEYSGAHICK